MANKKLEAEIAALKKALSNKDLPADQRELLEDALKNAESHQAKGEASAIKKEPGKKTATNKKSRMEDCEEIIKQAREARKKADERVAKRKKAGKPAELTVPETVKKAAKTVEKKVEKKEHDGKPVTKAEADAAVDQVVSLVEKIMEGLPNGSQRLAFLHAIINRIKNATPKSGIKKAEHGIHMESGNYGLHILKTPNGRYKFVGSIPENLVVEKKTAVGLPYTDSPTYDTKQELLDFYKEKMGEDFIKQAEHGMHTGTSRKGQMRILHYKTENFEISPAAHAIFEKILKQEDLLHNQKANVISMARSVDDFLGIVKRTKLREEGDKRMFVEATGHVMLAMYRLQAIVQALDLSDASELYPSFLAQDLFIVANHTRKTDEKLKIMEEGGLVLVEVGEGALSPAGQDLYLELMDEYDSMAGPRAKEDFCEHVRMLNRIASGYDDRTPEQEATRAGRARFLAETDHRMEAGGFIAVMEIVPIEDTMKQGGATDNKIEISVEGNVMNVHNYNGLQAAQMNLIRELQRDYIGTKDHDATRDHTYDVLKDKIIFPEGTSERNRQKVLANLTLDTMAKAVGREGIYKEGGKVHEHQREALTSQGEDFYEEIMAAYRSRGTDAAREDYRTHIRDMRNMAKKDEDNGYRVFSREPAEVAAFDKFLMVTDSEMKKGGHVKFKDKVQAIEKKLEGAKIPAKFRKGMGKAKKYTAKTAHAAAQRIVGAMESGEKGLRETLDKARNSVKKTKGKGKKKMLFGGITVGAPAGISSLEDQDNLNIHSMS